MTFTKDGIVASGLGLAFFAAGAAFLAGLAPHAGRIAEKARFAETVAAAPIVRVCAGGGVVRRAGEKLYLDVPGRGGWIAGDVSSESLCGA